KSLSQISKEIQEVNAEAGALQKELHQLAACCTDQLEAYSNDLRRDLSEQNALLQTSDALDGNIRVLEGWVPDERMKELNEYLEENQILFVSEKPADNDQVPILLKNNRFAKHYEMIGNLYELPNHRELDLV